MEEKMQKIKKIVKRELSCSAHNMDHVMRVLNLTKNLAKGKNIDLEVLQAATLLHDIARAKEDQDHTGATDHAVLGAEMAEKILKKLNFSKKKIKHIQDCIISHRSRTKHKPKTLEAKILFDADKIDAVGAIGIMRVFFWVAKNKAKIYSHPNIEEYIKNNLEGGIHGRIKDKTKHSPQLEYETKFKFLADKLYTSKAKKICQDRVNFFKQFLDRLEQEIKGEL